MTEAGSQPIKNVKHEKFAQLVSQGNYLTDSYESAGYKRSWQHARRLARKGNVRDRISWLQGIAAQSAVVTLESLIEQARGIMREARADKQLGAAVGALKELGILCGYRVEKREQKVTTSAEQLTDEELRAIAALGRPQLQIEASAVTNEGIELPGEKAA